MRGTRREREGKGKKDSNRNVRKEGKDRIGEINGSSRRSEYTLANNYNQVSGVTDVIRIQKRELPYFDKSR